MSSVTLVKEPQAKEMPMQHSILLQLWKHLLFSSGKLLTSLYIVKKVTHNLSCELNFGYLNMDYAAL